MLIIKKDKINPLIIKCKSVNCIEQCNTIKSYKTEADKYTKRQQSSKESNTIANNKINRLNHAIKYDISKC